MADRAPTVFLIDGYALIYRAFFAMINRPLRTSRGENTSAVWGVANFLHRLIERHHPDYVAWVHDSGSSFRTETYPEYKATREKLDQQLQEDFDRALERIEALLHAFGVELVEVEGFEADDVIGTLADRVVAAGCHAVIVSGDKDFYQLISERVHLLNPGRGGPAAVDEQLVDPANAQERLGVQPEQVVDYLALVGDASDNVPGVKGVGGKTAVSLLAEFGDLDTVLARAGDVKNKRAREALQAFADQARLSRALVTIRRDVPVGVELEALAVREPDADALRRLYGELEFHSLVPKLASADRPPGAETKCLLVDDAAHEKSAVQAARAGGALTIGVLRDGADARRSTVVGLCIAVAEGQAWYFPFGHRRPEGELLGGEEPHNVPPLTDEVHRALRAVLEDPTVRKSAHDIKDVWLALRRAGCELSGVAFDTMLASFVLDPGRRSHDLDVLGWEQLGLQVPGPGWLDGTNSAKRTAAEAAPRKAAEYCAQTTHAVHRLQEAFTPQLEATAGRRLFEDVEMPLIGVLVDMQWRGIAIDTERLGALSAAFRTELQELERAIVHEAGVDFNINSTQQLRHVLFEKLQLPIVKRTKTGASTDAGVLHHLATMGFAVPRLLLDYRELAKLRSTYVDVLPDYVNPETGRIHTRFNQTGAATGRLSSSDPNLQNIPVRTRRGERIRQCFVPADGAVFIVADYSQIELRLLAHLSQDPTFIAAFRRGGDIHRETASVIFDVPLEDVTSEMRARAKTINFATLYGQGPFALARQLDISQAEAREFIRLYFERFADVRTFLDATIEQARHRGFVETLLGRRRYIPELNDPAHNVRALGERTAMNSPMQGSAADVIKVAMIRVADALRDRGLETGMLLQVHDELVFESPEDEVDAAVELVRTEMEAAVQLDVDLVVDVGVGPNWLDAKR